MASAGSIRAGRAFVEMGAKDVGLAQGLARASRRIKAFGQSIASIGTKLAVLDLAKLAPLALATKFFADAGSELFDMSARTGLSVEALGELGHAAKQSGAEMTDLEIGAKRMGQFLVDAAKGSKEANVMLAGLGLNIRALSSLPADKRLEAIGLAIAKLPDEALRADAAVSIFGKSGTALIPMFADGAAGLAAMRQEAIRLGRPTSDQAQAADALGDAFGAMVTAAKNIVFAVGEELGPILRSAAEWMTGLAVGIRTFLKDNAGLVKAVFLGAAAFIALEVAVAAIGFALAGLGTALGFVATSITIVTGLIGFLTTPIGLVIAGLTALTAWFLTSTETGVQLLSWLGKHFTGLKDTALKAFAGISDALAAGDIKLAMEVLGAGLKVIWKRVMMALAEAWNTFAKSDFGQTVFKIAEIATSAFFLIRGAWISVIAALKSAWGSFSTWYQEKMSSWSDALAKGFVVIGHKVGALTDEEARFMIQDITRQTQQEQKDIDKRKEAAAKERAEIEKQKQKDLEELQKTRDSILNAIKNAPAGMDMSQLEKDLADAEANLDKLRNKAAEVRKEKEMEKAPGAPKQPELPPGAGQIQAGLEGMQRKVEARGTFAAAAVRGLGAESTTDKIEKNTRATADGVQKIAKKKGPVFA